MLPLYSKPGVLEIFQQRGCGSNGTKMPPKNAVFVHRFVKIPLTTTSRISSNKGVLCFWRGDFNLLLPSSCLITAQISVFQLYRLSIKTNHPAVTISFKKRGKLITDVDFAPVIEVKKWPKKFARRWKGQGWKGACKRFSSTTILN